MGRFSPSVLPGPSWTQGLAQGVEGIGQQLMARRQFNQQKLQQDREYGLQQQDQERQNAQAGYTPAQPYGASTPLDRVSNAGIGDAGTPASYDPTKSLTYALMSGRAGYANQRNEESIAGRLEGIDRNNDARSARDTSRFGSFDNGQYTPGSIAESHIFQNKPLMDYRQGALNDLTANRQTVNTETHRHHAAMEARPVGGSRTSVSSGGGLQAMTPQLAKQVSSNYSALSKPQPMVTKNGAVLEKYDQPLPPDQRQAEAIHRVNVGLKGAGADTLANPNTVAPASTSGAEKDGHAASTTTPKPQGSLQSLHQNGHAKQELTTTSETLPASPTAPTATVRKPLGAKDKQQAQTDPKAEAFYNSLGYKKGVDY